MSRDFSILRKKPNFLDLLTPLQDGVDGYKVSAADNFDGSFTELFTATRTGYVDPLIPFAMLSAQPSYSTSGRVRMTFDPDTFSLDGTAPFWILLTPVIGGVAGDDGAPHLIDPYKSSNRPIVTIAGTAPTGSDISDSLELVLPAAMTNLTVLNLEAADGDSLHIAFERSGPEIEVPAQMTFANTFGNVSSLFVRGEVSFQATSIYPNNI